MRGRPLRERFWEKVEILDLDQCWPWRGARTPNGYGRIGIDGSRVDIASRVSWRLNYGPIPDGMCVCHRCDNPGCVNPRHLFLGTRRDNIVDMYSKGRGNRPFGEKHVCARFTPQEVADIRAIYARGGVSQRTLGEQYGVSHKAIGRLVARVTWRHVA